MQQAQLGLFVAAMVALVVCGCIFTRKPRKKLQRDPCGRWCLTNINPAVSRLKKKGAKIGRAAGEPYPPLKKLNQVCDQRG